MVDFGDLACIGDLAEPESELTLDAADDADEADDAEFDFLFLSSDNKGFTADESAPIWEHVCANKAKGLFLVSIYFHKRGKREIMSIRKLFGC